MDKTILVADDDINIIAALQFLLQANEYKVLSVTTPRALIEQVNQSVVDCLLLDMNFQRDTTSGSEGLELISRIRASDPHLPIIVMTGWATVDLAVSALTSGANDFIQKPWQDPRLLSAIENQINAASTHYALKKTRAQNELLMHPIADFKAHSPAMKHCLQEIELLAKSNMNILLSGENGTGKSHYAHYIHTLSDRAEHPYVSVNMGALSDALFESEMFGHKRGAFTDAKQDRMGRFELASQGSLFLDEIANISVTQQAKLLHVLEEKLYQAVGSNKSLLADVRVISATNADMDKAIADGQFRQDLFYRLNTAHIHIPPLRERPEDVIPLAEMFLAQHSQNYSKTCPVLTSCAKSRLLSYSWPGNIRELKHLMERVLFTSTTLKISAANISLPMNNSFESGANDIDTANTISIDMTLEQIEANIMIERLAHFKGNVGAAAKSLGLSRSGWYRRIEKYQL